MQRRPLDWGALISSLALIALGAILLIDQARTLPEVIRTYWPIWPIVWGLWILFRRFRTQEDQWAGTDYGTGLYVIRHRRRRQSNSWIGLGLLLIGAFFMWANLNPAAGIIFGPIVLIVLGALLLLRSLLFL
jgi:hypothetical protein